MPEPTRETPVDEAGQQTPPPPAEETQPTADRDAGGGQAPAAEAPSTETPAAPPVGSGQTPATIVADTAQTAPPAAQAPAEQPPIAPANQAPSTTAPSEPAAPSGGEAEPAESAARRPDQDEAAEKMRPRVGQTPDVPELPKAVDIPRADLPLDADIEAELNAALRDPSADAPPVPMEQPSEPVDETVTQATSEADLHPGARLRGTVQSVQDDNVFIDFGLRLSGAVPTRQFTTKPAEVGHQVEVVVDRVDEEEGLILCNLPTGTRKVGGDWSAVSVGQALDCMVSKVNKGGLEVTISGLRGFIPASQVDLGYVSDLSQFVGQKLTAQVLEVNPQRRKLVLSRRALLAEERAASEKEIMKTLEPGSRYSGRVKSIKDFGAFVDLGGVDGLLHIGQISWSRINHPSDVLSEGEEIEVQVLSVDKDKKKISLGMRQLQANPWSKAENVYQVGSIVRGKVTRTTDFGAFVELERGIEGLIHISELDYKRVNRVADVLKTGDEIEMKVLEVDPGRKRVSLSLKQVKENPYEAEEAASGEAFEEAKRRESPRRNRKLRGGTTGENQGGGLFGDPRDYQ